MTACKATSCTGTPDKVAFTYDGEGHRIRIVETPASGTPTTTDFAYEGDAVVRETATTGANVITRTFTTDEAGAIIKMTEAETGDATDETYLVTWNGHGDAIGLAEINSTDDGSLIPALRVVYSTWGTPTVQPESGYSHLKFRYLYVGRFDVQWDHYAGAGLLYMHARHYSPEFGRFLTPDPSALETNLYGYAENSPVTKVDPSGELSINPAEYEYCVLGSLWSWRRLRICQQWAVISWVALAVAQDETNTIPKENALRQCLWQACLTSVLGYWTAWKFGSLHEKDSNNPSDTEIDLHNNRVGRNIRLTIKSGRVRDFLPACKRALANGRLRT